jgi:hypothetical protein
MLSKSLSVSYLYCKIRVPLWYELWLAPNFYQRGICFVNGHFLMSFTSENILRSYGFLYRIFKEF